MLLSPQRSTTMLTSKATLKESIQSQKAMRKKDDKLWFDDGTLIIVAQDTEFRVYKGQLERRSEVFKDMSSFPQPAVDCSDSPCPVVHVTDSARDWRYVLALIFDPDDGQGHYPTDRFPHPSFESISACVRLGHKYAMTSTYQQAMAYLQDIFTTRCSVFQSRSTWVPAGSGWKMAHAVGVVNLARLTGTCSILPLALLICCRRGADLVEGFTYSDGERETLSEADLGLCFAAKDKLVAATMVSFLDNYSQLPAGTCKRKDGSDVCRWFLQLLSRRASRKAQSFPMPNPMIAFNYTPFGVAHPLCENCMAAIKERERKRQLANWQKLPTMLGIDVPGW